MDRAAFPPNEEQEDDKGTLVLSALRRVKARCGDAVRHTGTGHRRGGTTWDRGCTYYPLGRRRGNNNIGSVRLQEGRCSSAARRRLSCLPTYFSRSPTHTRRQAARPGCMTALRASPHDSDQLIDNVGRGHGVFVGQQEQKVVMVKRGEVTALGALARRGRSIGRPDHVDALLASVVLQPSSSSTPIVSRGRHLQCPRRLVTRDHHGVIGSEPPTSHLGFNLLNQA